MADTTADDEDFAEGARPSDLEVDADTTAEAVRTWGAMEETEAKRLAEMAEIPMDRFLSAGSGGTGSTVRTAVVAAFLPLNELESSDKGREEREPRDLATAFRLGDLLIWAVSKGSTTRAESARPEARATRGTTGISM